MKLKPHEQEPALMPVKPRLNRRRQPRMGGQFELIFSGMDKGQIMMGDGEVLNLSREGIGIRANQLLKPGMELALFIQLPDSEDHLCISEALVSWVSGSHFGVALRTLRLEDQNRLRFFLWEQERQTAAQRSEDIDSTV